MDTLTIEQQQTGLVIRTARKRWYCDEYVGWEGDTRVVCGKEIAPGSRYLEYLGEAAAFQSGYRYCTEHAFASWGVRL